VIYMADGSEFRYPMTYKDVCDAGWRLEYENEKEILADGISPEESGWFSFINDDGKTVNIELFNVEESTIPTDDAKVTQIHAGNVSTEEFSVEGISRGSTVQEIIDRFGLPYGSIYYKWESGTDSLSIYYVSRDDDSIYASLDFSFDTETGLLDYICYSVSDPTWWEE